MIPEKAFEREVWFVLNKIKKQSLKADIIKYWIKSPPDPETKDIISPKDEMETIDFLIEKGAIKEISSSDVGEVLDSEESISRGLRVSIVIRYLKINNKKFDDIYKEYQEKNISLRKNEKIQLYITPEGDLFRYDEYGDKLVYPITKNSTRHKIIKILLDKKSFKGTKEIAKQIGTTTKTIHKEISGIRRQIKKRLHIVDGKEIIEGKYGSGYRINHKIKQSEA